MNKSYPSDFLNDPMDSMFQKGEYEIVARNIMVILYMTGNKFRKLSWEEYKDYRMKDGNFNDNEALYFDSVVAYTLSPDIAKLFSPAWADNNAN